MLKSGSLVPFRAQVTFVLLLVPGVGTAPAGAGLSLAEHVQIWAPVALVLVTIVYVILVKRQVDASERTVNRLVQRDRQQEIQDLRMIEAAMLSLTSEAQRWDDMPDVLGIARRGALPKDSFTSAEISGAASTAASYGGEIRESTWRALESARDAQHELDKLRGWRERASGATAEDTLKSFGQAIADVRELGRKAAAVAAKEVEAVEDEENR